MAVTVTHYNLDTAQCSNTDHDVNSWSIDDHGNLTVGDSVGNPEASYAHGHWRKVVKVVDDEDLLD